MRSVGYFKKGHVVPEENKLLSYYRLTKWHKARDRTKWVNSIRAAMANPAVKERLSALNRRKRRPMSDAHRAKISATLTGRMPKNMINGGGSFANIQRGVYGINGREMYFRSKWEANYALYLDFMVKQKQIKSWSYESQVFVFDEVAFGTRSYLPDFKVINNDDSVEFHEVKGYLTGRAKTQLRRMKKYYPRTILKLVDGEQMRALNKYKKLLGFY